MIVHLDTASARRWAAQRQPQPRDTETSEVSERLHRRQRAVDSVHSVVVAVISSEGRSWRAALLLCTGMSGDTPTEWLKRGVYLVEVDSDHAGVDAVARDFSLCDPGSQGGFLDT